MEESYFIKVDNPSHLQKLVLLSAKQMLEITKSQLALKAIAEKKVLIKDDICKKLLLITQHIEKLQSSMPHKELLHEFHNPQLQKEEKIISEIKAKKPAPKPASDLDKLNDAIKSIEEKLANLK